MRFSPDRLSITLAMGAAAAAAAIAAVPPAYDGGVGLRPTIWLSGTAAGVAAAASMLIALRRSGTPLWSRIVVAISAAALGPLAQEAATSPLRADLAFVATAMAIGAAGSGRAGTAASTLPIVVAAFFDTTSLVLPIGFAWAALSELRSRGLGIVILAGGLAGWIAGTVAGGAGVLPGWAGPMALHAAHRDLRLLLPVVLVGLGGYANRDRQRPEQAWAGGAAAAGILVILAAIAGLRFAVRIAVLPLWWWMAAGLAELAELMRHRVDSGVLARRVAWATCVLACLLALRPLDRWAGGALLILYLTGR